MLLRSLHATFARGGGEDQVIEISFQRASFGIPNEGKKSFEASRMNETRRERIMWRSLSTHMSLLIQDLYSLVF